MSIHTAVVWEARGTRVSVADVRRFDGRWNRFVNPLGNDNVWNRDNRLVKCDIRKFFASIDQTILMDILARYITDKGILALLAEVISSFATPPVLCTTVGHTGAERKGLPLGNLTPQLLVNIYMNEFDQHMKHWLKAKYYIRYAYDFVFLSHDRSRLQEIERYIALLLHERLRLDPHPGKVFIKTFASGVDFLGWVHFPDHRVLRTATKRRMLRNMEGNTSDARRESYRGMVRHGNAQRIAATIDPMAQKE